jgi:hypothetical protein
MGLAERCRGLLVAQVVEHLDQIGYVVDGSSYSERVGVVESSTGDLPGLYEFVILFVFPLAHANLLPTHPMIRRTLIVTPANLTFQWQRELKDKFRENFEVIRSDVLRANYGSNPWQDKNQVITSVSWVSRVEDAKESLQQITNAADRAMAARLRSTASAMAAGGTAYATTEHASREAVTALTPGAG